MRKYYNNGIECHLFEEGTQPEGYISGKLYYDPVPEEKFEEIADYFSTHTQWETCLNFHINGHQLGDVCKKVNYVKPQNLIVATRTRRNNEVYGVDNVFQLQSVIDKSMHTRIEKFGSLKAAYEDRNKQTALTLQTKTGIPDITNVFQLEEVKQKSIETLLENNPGKTLFEIRSIASLKGQNTKEIKYGYRGVPQTKEVRSKQRRKYCYFGETFDSSWELALWIYAKDHNEEIEHEPIEINYYVDGKQHTYFPDFLYKGELVEIKGGQFIINDNLVNPYIEDGDNDTSFYKLQCMIDNNVRLITCVQIEPFIEYVKNTYGKNYLKSFRNK